MGRTIRALEILRDFKAGLPMEVIADKYKLPPDQIVGVMKQIFKERDARARQIAADVKSGMTTEELIRKYRLTEDRFGSILKMLVDERYLARGYAPTLNGIVEADSVILDLQAAPRSRPMLLNRVPAVHEVTAGDSVFLDLRSVPRVRPPIVVRVQYGTDSGSTCTLRDASEHGLGLTGLRAELNERKTLRVLGDDWGEVAPFECDGSCRWVVHGGTRQSGAAGFMITRITDVDFHLLRSFVRGFARA